MWPYGGSSPYYADYYKWGIGTGGEPATLPQTPPQQSLQRISVGPYPDYHWTSPISNVRYWQRGASDAPTAAGTLYTDGIDYLKARALYCKQNDLLMILMCHPGEDFSTDLQNKLTALFSYTDSIGLPTRTFGRG